MMTAEHNDTSFTYIVFNQPWENYLSKMGRHVTSEYQQFRPLFLNSQSEVYEYLRNSIATYILSSKKSNQEFTICLVELDEQIGVKSVIDDINNLINSVAPSSSVKYIVIPHDDIRKFIDIELGRNSPHRSPNKIHEYVIFRLIQNSTKKYVCISDCDTLYLQDDYLKICKQIVRSNNKAVVSFIDIHRPAKVSYVPSRMHTVSLFIDIDKINGLFDMEQEIRDTFDFKARAKRVKNPSDRKYFLETLSADTLSLFTVDLERGWDTNYLADISHFVEYSFEDAMLVLGNEYLAHAKYFDTNAMNLLKKNYQQNTAYYRNLTKTVNYLLSLS